MTFNGERKDTSQAANYMMLGSMDRHTASATDESTPAAPACGAKLGEQPSKERTYATCVNPLSGSVR